MRPLLLIEDDPDVAAVLAEALSDDGYPVAVATSPKAARALLATHGPTAHSLVLTDALAVSRHDLYAWIDELRGLTDAPIILCTGWSVTAFADYQAHGVAALLTKPFNVDEILALVAAVAAANVTPQV